MMLQTTGLKVIEVVEYWFQRSPWDIGRYPKNTIAEQVVDEMIMLIQEQ